MKTNALMKLVLFSALLLVVRYIKTGHFTFVFLFWNLFLAWLPWLFIKKYESLKTTKYKNMFLVVCILFLPNAPYIITDLFHLSKNLVAPQWFDLVLILSFSIVGLLLFILTADRLFCILNTRLEPGLKLSTLKFLVYLSNGYGIYLGRYLRFNSWDVVSNPLELTKKMFHSVFDLSNYKETLAVTLIFTVFLYLVMELYQFLKNQQHNLHELS